MEMSNFDPTDSPTISDSITDKDIASSNFSQVVFPDVPDTFPPKQDIRVSYVISEELVPTSRDWIGLFKVGWTTPREYITFVWSPKPSTDNVSAVNFSSYYLPNDESEFYQFCFVTKQGLVKGASTPFQFRDRSEHTELVEVEDETGMIVLKTKSAAMQDALDKALKNKEDLEQDLEEVKKNKEVLEEQLMTVNNDLKTTSDALFMEKERSEEAEKKFELLSETHKAMEILLKEANETISLLENNILSLEQVRNDLQSQVDELNMKICDHESRYSSDVEALNKQLDTKVQELCGTQVQVADLRNNVQELTLHQDELKKSNEDTKEQTSTSLKKMQVEKDAAIAKLLRYKDEKELFQKQFQESEQHRLELAAKMKKISDKIEQKNFELVEAVDKVAAQNQKINILRNEIKAQKTHELKQRQTIEKEMSLVEDRLNASEASKRLIAVELSEARESRDKLMSDLNKLKQEKEELLKKLSWFKNEKKICDSVLMELRENAIQDGETITRLEQEKQKEVQTQKKMKKQIRQLERQLETIETEQAEVQKTTQETMLLQEAAAQTEHTTEEETVVDDESVIDDLKTQIEDLRTRLSMGAAAYTEKYIECHKLEKKLKKIQATTKSPMIREQATAMLESTTTSDSQLDETSSNKTQPQKSKSGNGTRKSRRGGAAKKTSPAVGSPEQRSGMLGKLEQLFLAIADPDAEEQEHAQQLQEKLRDLERNVQFQHSKYKKYKLLFQEEKQKHLSEISDLNLQVERLNAQLSDEQTKCESLTNENKALQEQVSEFVQVSQDVNVIKTKTVDGLKYGNPYKTPDVSHEVVEIPSLRHRNPYAVESNSKKSDEETSSGESSLEYIGGPSFLSLCPKNISSDDSDAIEITHPPRESPCGSNTVTNQPIRSPPLIEVLEDKQAETPAHKPIKRTTARQRIKKKSRSHKSYA